MRYKKHMIILLAAIFLFAMATASASDSNDVLTASADDSPVELSESGKSNELSLTDEIQIIGEANNPEVMGAPDNGTFAALDYKIKTSKDDIIKLENDYKYEGEGYPNGILINKSLITIDGHGHTIDADGKTRIFNITGERVDFTNITFVNGCAENGGALYSSESVSVRHCNFVNNSANKWGGAVYSNYGGTIFSSNFVANSVVKDNEEGAGGAVYFYQDYGNLFNDIFVDNYAANYGAVHLASRRGNVRGCIFVNNSANKGIVGQAFDSTDGIQIHENIFLNNNVSVNIIDFAAGENVDANFNWFGSNATDYTKNPDLQFGDVWLFLNATADPDSVIVSGTSDITFKLYAFDSTSNIVSDYNLAFTDPVGLTVTAIGGNASSSIIDFGETVTYTANTAGTGKITASIENAAYTIEVNVIKANSTLTVDDMVFEYNAAGSTTVSFTNATGVKANVVNHTEAIVKVEEKTITVSNLAIGNYTLNVTTLVDGNHNPVTETAGITVKKAPTEISIINQTMNLKAKDTVSDFANLTPADAGNLTFVSSNEDVIIVKGGRIVAVGAGKANVTVSFAGNENYTAAENKTVSLTVTALDASVNVTKTRYELIIDETDNIVVTTVPEGLKVDFTTDDDDVISVDGEGKITALAEGNALIYVSVGDNVVYKYSVVNVHVTVSKIPTEISLTNETIDLKVYGIADGLANLTPADAGKLTYTSDDESIVLVDEAGLIFARGKGTATVTVSFAGNDKYAAAENRTITVNVTLNYASVSTENDTIDLYVDDACIINATANPSFLTVYYASSNESVATVTDYGNVKAVGEGTAVITLTVGNGETYAVNSTNVTVTVSKVLTEISIENDTLKLEVTDEVDTGATLTPADAGNVTYTISNSSIVKVKDGKVIALAEGEAAITVSFVGDVKYAVAENKTITVNVSLKDASVSVNNDTLDLFVDDTFNLVATTEPKDLTVNFTSSNPSIVTVDNKGNVVAVGEGIANITVSVGCDGVYAENSTIVTVTVSKIPTEIIVQNATVDMNVGDIFDPVVSLMPSNAGRLSFRSSNDTVVLINGHGMIKAVGEGNATVTVAFDGNEKYAAVSRNITVSVSKQDANINVSMPENVTVGENSTVNVVLPDDATGNVTVMVDGEVVDTVAVTDGTADVTIPPMVAGNHTVEIDYSGDDKYNSASKTPTITVNKDSTNIASADVTATYKVNKYLVIKLTDSRGNPLANSTVTVELSTAKNYTSDENGQIKVKVSNKAPKTYTAKITFAGNNNYLGSEATAKVVVKKATPKITAKTITFKTTTKTKKYTITLKDNTGKAIKNAKVALKVNGKTYKATTNSKGKATFKITKLTKKGTFKATVTYKGNKYFKKVTKKVNIKVKSVWKTVQKGSKNKAIVKKIQRALKKHGYYLTYNGHYLKVDGIFWDYTKMAVKEFQNDKTLKVTGKVDEKTAKKLGII